MPTLINGQATTCLDAADRGLHYGDGLFETLAVEAGRPRFWARHMARLQAGCERLGIAGPAPDVLAREAAVLCEAQAAPASRAVLKIIVTRGGGGRGYAVTGTGPPTRLLSLHDWPALPASHATAGVRLRLCRTRLAENPRLAGLKHLNRLEQVLARAEWSDADIAEGLMCNQAGEVIEGTMSNVFVVRDGVLCTPDLSRCGVAGVRRAVILELAGQLGIPCETAPLPLAELYQAQEIFITNSVIGLWPVRRLETQDFEPGPVSRRLQAAIAQLREDACG